MLSLHLKVVPVAGGLMRCLSPCLERTWSSASCFRPVTGRFQDCQYQKQLEKSWQPWHLILRLWEGCVLATISDPAKRELFLFLSRWNYPQLPFISYLLLLTLVLNLIPLCHTAFSFLLEEYFVPKAWVALPAQLHHLWISLSSQRTSLCPSVQHLWAPNCVYRCIEVNRSSKVLILGLNLYWLLPWLIIPSTRKERVKRGKKKESSLKMKPNKPISAKL